jgi:hypothetical protein
LKKAKKTEYSSLTKIQLYLWERQELLKKPLAYPEELFRALSMGCSTFQVGTTNTEVLDMLVKEDRICFVDPKTFKVNDPQYYTSKLWG